MNQDIFLTIAQGDSVVFETADIKNAKAKVNNIDFVQNVILLTDVIWGKYSFDRCDHLILSFEKITKIAKFNTPKKSLWLKIAYGF